MTIRTYSELIELPTFEERFRYLMLRSQVGLATFGHERHLNQKFYTSRQWRHLRNHIIVRDDGCDLGIPDREIHQRLVIHHMNPMLAKDLIHGNDDILDPEFLITTMHKTHNAIHYGDESILRPKFVERQPGDTKLW